MRIPDGDLVPRRRRSRYGGGYGRRRRATRGGALVVVLLLLAAGLVYWFGIRDEPTKVAALEPCPTPTVSPTPVAAVLPAPRAVRLALLNGTPRNGLAHSVAGQLRARGFVVVSEGNASAALGGASTITYGPGGAAAATVLSRHVLGSRLVSAPRAAVRSVALVLGGDYRRLRTPAEVAALATPTAPAAAVPAPSRSACAP